MRKLNVCEDLTSKSMEANIIWDEIALSLEKADRKDVMQNLSVLDLGGGMGRFSKELNKQKIDCVSLDIQDLKNNPGANQIRANAYKMPFSDEAFSLVHERGIFDNRIYPHDFPQLLKEIARVLKTRGILSVYDADPPPEEELKKYFKLLTPGEEFPTLWEKT